MYVEVEDGSKKEGSREGEEEKEKGKKEEEEGSERAHDQNVMGGNS